MVEILGRESEASLCVVFFLVFFSSTYVCDDQNLRIWALLIFSTSFLIRYIRTPHLISGFSLSISALHFLTRNLSLH